MQNNIENSIEFKKINESYFSVSNLSQNVFNAITENLTVFQDGYQFNPAYRMGQWDGKVRFFKVFSDKNSGVSNSLLIPFGFFENVLNFVKKNSLSFSLNASNGFDKNSNFKFNKEDFMNFIDNINLPFKPYDYQLEGAIKILQDKRLILQAATGAGKSFIIYLALRYLHSKNKKILVIVPNISLTLQLKSDFISYNWKETDEQVKLIGGEFNNKDLETHNVIISTWQSLARIPKEHLKRFDVLINDETHNAKSLILNQIITDTENAYIRVGLTGTVPRVKADRFKIISVFGKVHKLITPQGLIEKGLATPVEIKLLYFIHNKRRFSNYKKEIEYLDNNQKRTEIISNIASKVSFLNKDKQENSLVLFNTVEFGKFLFENIISKKLKTRNFKVFEKTQIKLQDIIKKDDFGEEVFENLIVMSNEDKISLKLKLQKIHDECTSELLKEDIKKINVLSTFDLNVFLIYGGIKAKIREQIRNSIENLRGAVLVGSFKTVSTGINIKAIHNIFITSTTKSFFTIMQGIGRGMRLHKSKDRVRIWDIVDVIDEEKENYSLRHSQERIEIYYDCEYPISEKDIKL